MSSRLVQAAGKLAAATVRAATPERWAVQVYDVTNRETTGLVHAGPIIAGGEADRWVQVRNDVYLAAGEKIWIARDSAAQDNWIFDGFIKGGGAGESAADAPIPCVAAPVITAPANTPLVVRAPTGQTTTIGRAGDTTEIAGDIELFPFDEVFTVSLTDSHADYNNIEAALDAATGEQVRVSPETHSCSNKTLTSGTSLVGLDMMLTTLSSSAADPIITVLNSSSYLAEFQARCTHVPTALTGAIKIAPTASPYTVTLQHVYAYYYDASSAQISAGFCVTGATWPKAQLFDCMGKSQGATNCFALYASGSQTKVYVYGGLYEGSSGDIYADKDAEIFLYGPTLSGYGNAVVENAGGRVYGWYYTPNGDYHAMEDPDPAGHRHSKLVASDGSPDPALSADAAGDLAAVGKLEVVADVYPDSDNAGTRERLDHWQSANIDDHFTALTGWTWAGAPFDGAASTCNVTTSNSLLRFQNDDVTEDHFYYKAASGVGLTMARLTKGVGSYVGIRVDDGTDNNYAEFRLVDGSVTGFYRLQYRHRTGGGAITTTYYADGLPVAFYALAIWKDASLSAVYYSQDTPIVYYFTAVAQAWTRTRAGMIFGQRGATSADRAGYVDWIRLS